VALIADRILSFGAGRWSKAHEQIILTAQTGTAKPGLPVAFAHQAAPHGFNSVGLCPHAAPLLKIWPQPRPMDASRKPDRQACARPGSSFLGDGETIGLTDQQAPFDLLELFENGYQRRSTIITAQLPVIRLASD